MNVVSGNQEVVSKYFTDGKFNMDESASDFQEPKKKCTGPKTGKVVKAKPKTKRKPTKKIKGQKDIRVALKENDIVEYTKKFNNICRKSGIDVDSEQLQLAIALSESLADKDKETEASSSKELTATQQSGVIRKTLQQYGFKVQENVKSTGGRKNKYKKESKLLCTSEEQKKQIIADRYSEVLFQSLQTALIIEKNSELYGFSDKDTILNKACNVDYKTVKQTENFYIENLIEVHPNSIGSLLRDWSKIPGRPLSPTVTKVHDFQITNLEFTEKEIDVLLSGKLDLAQKVVIDKIKDMKPESKDCNHNTSIEELCSEETMKCTEDHLLHTEKDNGFNIKSKIGFVTSSNSEGAIIVSPQNTKIAKIPLLLPRCESPDLFDDDLTIDISNDVLPDSQTIEEASKAETVCEVTLDNVTRKKSNDFMDLTECVKNPKGYNKVVDESITLTQTADTRECTKRKSDDFMEITECVNNDPNETSKTENNATLLLKDTTGRNLEDFIEITDCVTHATSKETDIKDNIDLTQGSEENDETIIVEYVNETAQNMDNVKMDLTQSTNSDDSLPFVDIGGTRNKTILITEEIIEIEKVKSPSKDVNCDHANSKTNSINVERHSKSSKSSDVFDEFVYEHCHSSPEEKFTVDLTEESSNNVKHIDLTQSAESEEVAETTIINVELQDNNQDIINDENNDNISTEVPYDDYIDIVNEHPIDFIHSKDDTVLYYDIESNNIEVNTDEAKQSTPEISQKQTTESLSQNSEIFEISDEELNYSVHKSKHYSADNSQDIPTTQNFDFGGLSVLDNIGSLASFTKSRISEPNTSTQGDDISLPIFNIRGTNVKTKSPNSTPTKTTIENAVQTPRNSDFIIKLDQVTPISDYASMTTPERNTELDKFGLKPLKRKRAIQILTHLYNQTHPLVEDTDIASPSKKQKPTTSPRKNTNDNEFKKKIDYDNPNKEMITNNDVTEFIEQEKITCKIDNIEEDFLKESRTVLHTEDNPVVKDIEDCDEDDWVFQKREKSKVHTCRLPLHIAFHNYVSTSKNLRESILRYEPVNIEEIHKDLAAFGHRYHPKDLLKFLDKKCITVKTADNNGRNQNNKKTLKKS